MITGIGSADFGIDSGLSDAATDATTVAEDSDVLADFGERI